MKLALRFLVLSLAGVLLVHALFATYTVGREMQLYDQDAWNDHGHLVRAIVPAFVRAWQRDGSAEALRVLAAVTAREADLSVTWLPKGAADAPPASDATADGLVHRHVADARRGTFDLVTYAPVHFRQVDGHIVIRESSAARQAFLHRSLWNVGFKVAGVFAWVAMISIIFGVGLIGRPLHRLVLQARQVGEGELNARSGLASHDEIGELSREMDRMASHLESGQRQLAKETAARLRVLNQLRHADRLATVGKLASGVAHELGTPLNIVLGRAKMIRKDETLPQAHRKNARIISEQVERMVEIVRQLLGFARAEEAEKAIVDAGTVITKSLALLEPMAKKRGVMIRAEAPPHNRLNDKLNDKPNDNPNDRLRVEANAGQLQQVIANLVVNALQASREGTTVTVAWRQEPAAEVESMPLLPHAAIRVTDEGCGMTPSVRARLFEPFFTTKEVGEGTGLGLSVAYGIVEDHGGFIRVESEEGHGSCFSVYLPLPLESLSTEAPEPSR